jgi:hypothetical protein
MTNQPARESLETRIDQLEERLLSSLLRLARCERGPATALVLVGMSFAVTEIGRLNDQLTVRAVR